MSLRINRRPPGNPGPWHREIHRFLTEQALGIENAVPLGVLLQHLRPWSKTRGLILVDRVLTEEDFGRQVRALCREALTEYQLPVLSSSGGPGTGNRGKGGHYAGRPGVSRDWAKFKREVRSRIIALVRTERATVWARERCESAHETGRAPRQMDLISAAATSRHRHAYT